MKNTLTGIKNKLEEINITLDEAQYLTSNLEDKVLEQSEQEKKIKRWGSLKDFWGNIKRTIIHTRELSMRGHQKNQNYLLKGGPLTV